MLSYEWISACLLLIAMSGLCSSQHREYETLDSCIKDLAAPGQVYIVIIKLVEINIFMFTKCLTSLSTQSVQNTVVTVLNIEKHSCR